MFAQVPDFIWVNSATGAGNYPTDMVTDANGNTYVAGSFGTSTITFGSQTLTRAGVTGYDCFIVKYNPSGNVLWAKSFGGETTDIIRAIAVDSTGNISITGVSSSPNIVFGDVTLVNSTNPFPNTYLIFTVKMDGAGNVLWGKKGQSQGIASAESGNSITMDNQGNVIIAGTYYSATMVFDSVTFPATNTYQYFLVKYDSSGNIVWTKSTPGNVATSTSSHSGGVTCDASGNVYLTGNYFTNTSFMVDSVILPSSRNTFVAKYSPSGAIFWAKAATAALNSPSSDDIIWSPSGKLAITGKYYGQIDFGSTTLSGTSNGNAFIATYDEDGNELWAKTSESQLGGHMGHKIAVDGSGNFYCSGKFGNQTITFEGFTLTDSSSANYLVKYNASGNVVWAVKIDAASSIEVINHGLSVYENLIYVSGFCTNNSVFGTFTAPMGVFTAKLDQSVLGISNFAQTSAVLYPNPTSGILNISVNLDDAVKDVIAYDLSGKAIRVKYDSVQSGISADVSAFAKGNYIVEIVTEKGKKTRMKFIRE